jgi:nicotinate phosphoribosyltransferase
MSNKIISSMIDSDAYKFSMQQCILHQFPAVEVRYNFKCRNIPKIPLETYMDEIKEEIKNFCSLRFTKEELVYLSGIRYFKKDYIDFLKYFQLDYDNVKFSTHNGFELKINGNWRDTILFEVPILSIINEVYFRHQYLDRSLSINNLNNKIDFIKNNPFTLIEFGTRRRYSKLWQSQVVQILKQEIPDLLFGTSNAKLAMENKLNLSGTVAHEFFCACQQLGPKLLDSQKFALQKWVDEYRGDLGIALSDTLGLDAFLRDFDSYFAKLYDGVRHDSGDPIIAGNKIIKHYEKLKIDPMTKTIVFSDSLDFKKAREIHLEFFGKIKTAFGIGTNLTNDCGVEPLQIVIKMTHCNGQPVAKISDNSGKGMCEDESYLKYLKSVFSIGE